MERSPDQLTGSALRQIQGGSVQGDRLAAALGVARVDGELVAGARIQAAYTEARRLARHVVEEATAGLWGARTRLELYQQCELLGQTSVEAVETLGAQTLRRRILNGAVMRRVWSTCINGTRCFSLLRFGRPRPRAHPDFSFPRKAL
jgi:hypothetical protein